MNKVLTADTHRLRNIFIMLKNGGKDIDTIIKEMPGVSREDLLKWDEEFMAEFEKLSNVPGLTKNNPDKVLQNNYGFSPITGIDRNGRYIIKLKHNISLLEKIKFDLFKLSSLDLNDENLDKDLIDKYKLQELKEKSRYYFTFFNNNLSDIKLNKSNEDLNYEYSLTHDVSPNEVEEALEFYTKNILASEMNSDKKRSKPEPTAYHYDIASDILPIAIKSIVIEHYSGINKLEVNEIHVDSKWIFITGENGFGKTSFLQALAIGLVGNRDQKEDLLFENPGAEITVEYKYDAISVMNSISNPPLTPLKELVCYGPSRLTMQSEYSKEDDIGFLSVTKSLFSAQSTLLNIENRLIIWKLSNDKKFNYVVDAFKKMLPYLADIKLSGDNTKILYVEKDPESNETYKEVPFLKLASGFRSLIAMVGDMILRFYQHQPEIQNPSDFRGIVLIDELDLHWHPKLQMQLPGILSNIFPFIQFIASTHSAIPILGAPKQTTILKIIRSAEEGVTIQKMDIDITTLTPNIILTSPIFDMESITSVSKENLSVVRTEDNFEQMKKSDESDSVLEKFSTEQNTYPDSLFL